MAKTLYSKQRSLKSRMAASFAFVQAVTDLKFILYPRLKMMLETVLQKGLHICGSTHRIFQIMLNLSRMPQRSS